MDESNRIEVHDPNPVWGSADGAPGAGGSAVSGGDGGTLGATGAGYGVDFDPAPEPFVAVTPKKSSSTLLNVVLGLAVVVAIGGVAFAAGRLTAPAAAANGFTPGGGNGFANGPRPSGAPGNLRGAGFDGGALRGTVTAVTPTSITLTLSSGTTIQIPTDSSTAYHQQAAATSTDVAVGSTVLVELKDQGGAPVTTGPGASLAPGATPGTPTVGAATDVTVVAN
jgi:hypothetical protein